MNTSPPELKDRQEQNQRHRLSSTSFKPVRLTLTLPDREKLPPLRGTSISHRSPGTPAELHSDPEVFRKNESISLSADQQQQLSSVEFDRESGVEAIEECYSEFGDDRGGVGRPWANSEDVSYFLLKVIAGNAMVLIDFAVAAR